MDEQVRTTRTWTMRRVGGDCERGAADPVPLPRRRADRRAAAQAIQQHLDECSPCLEAFDFEAELKIVIARCCRDQVPEGLRQRIADVLRQAAGIRAIRDAGKLV